MADQEQTAGRGTSAPYTSFPSMKTLVKSLKEHGVPGRIDRSVLGNFSGAVGSQLMTAMKFLRLTDAGGHPTEELKSLASAYGTDDWPGTLGGVVRDAYQPIFQLNLETASPSQFNEAFRRAYPGTDEVQRKCITFFLSAANDAQIKISAYIMKNKKPRTGPAKKRVKSNGNGRSSGPASDPTPPTPPTPPAPPQIPKMISEALLAHFNPTEMDDAQQEAVWTLLKYFKGKGL